MLTNLDFLNIGQPYPIADKDIEAMHESYETGRLLYDGQIKTVFKKTWQKLVIRYGLTDDDISQIAIAVNLFKPLTEVFKILAFDKEPEIVAKKAQDKVTEYAKKVKFIRNILKRSFVSGHAQGNGIIKVYIKDGEVKIGSVNPEFWYPVYSPDSLDDINAHVFITDYEVTQGVNWKGNPIVQKYIKVEINEKGRITERTHLIKNGKIADLIYKEITTDYAKDYKWSDFLVFPFDYGRPNWKEYGASAYEDLISIVEELIVRLSNNSKILDDHADPQIVASSECYEHDVRTGKKTYRRGQALVLNGKDAQKPEYLTWDGNLDASEKQIDRMLQFYYMIAGANPQLYGQDISGNLSGSALEKIFLIPLSKTKEMTESLAEAGENSFNCACALSGLDATVNIEFNIGMFDTLADISEQAMNELSNGASSIERVVKKINPKYDVKQATKEVLKIKDENKISVPEINNIGMNDNDDSTT